LEGQKERNKGEEQSFLRGVAGKLQRLLGNGEKVKEPDWKTPLAEGENERQQEKKSKKRRGSPNKTCLCMVGGGAGETRIYCATGQSAGKIYTNVQGGGGRGGTMDLGKNRDAWGGGWTVKEMLDLAEATKTKEKAQRL